MIDLLAILGCELTGDFTLASLSDFILMMNGDVIILC